MIVDLGPLPSRHVTVWVDYAQSVVDELRQAPQADGVAVPADALDAFDGYLQQWARRARRSKTFTWAGEADAEVVQYLLNAFHHIAVELNEAAEAQGTSLGPEEGEPFYLMLVRALLDSLEQESPACAEFVAHLRAFWPGLTPTSLH